MILPRDRMSRKTARQVGDLREQIRVATSGVPLDSIAPAIRVRRKGTTVRIAACELWARVGARPERRRICELPAAQGLRLQFLEKAVENAGFGFATTDREDRGRWHHVPFRRFGEKQQWYELILAVPGHGQTGVSGVGNRPWSRTAISH